MSKSVKTEAGLEIPVSEIINVIPYTEGRLLALTIAEDGELLEHKIPATDYYVARGNL